MAPSRKSPRPLAAARGIEATKFRDYKSFAEERGGKFLPFVMESLGAFGKHTGEILKSLSKAATTVTLAMSPSEFLQFCQTSATCCPPTWQRTGGEGWRSQRTGQARCYRASEQGSLTDAAQRLDYVLVLACQSVCCEATPCERPNRVSVRLFMR